MPPPPAASASDPEQQPLLTADRNRLPSSSSSSSANDDIVDCHIAKLHGPDSNVYTIRSRLRTFFASKYGHYFVIILVTLDITCIFADFLIKLHICEHTCGDTPTKGFDPKPWTRGVEVLAIMSLLFSSLFMGELLASIFAFGPGKFFANVFHIFDASVIVIAFVVELLLRGPLEEVGGLVVVLRLWRVFKIVEEFSAGAEDELEGVREQCQGLEEEVKGWKRENEGLRKRIAEMAQGDGSGRLNGHHG